MEIHGLRMLQALKDRKTFSGNRYFIILDATYYLYGFIHYKAPQNAQPCRHIAKIHSNLSSQSQF